mmetsp:Transcript_97232/g.187437  ORF Transcript_97232/g.187437 Transcript_97232/m.187437 type:complete len:231 (-) Transcript_97232:122-814(-)
MQTTARQPFNVHSHHTVFGLEIQDARLASLTRRVLVLATISATIVIAKTVWELVYNQGTPAVASVIAAILGLAVPACGYFGAKKSDQNLTCCFCGCNFLGSCGQLLTLCSSWALYKFAAYVVDHCDPGKKDPNDDSCKLNWKQIFCQKNPDWSDQHCYNFVEDQERALKTAVMTATLISIPLILLQCLSFCWGKKLYDVLKAGDVIHVPPSQFVTRPVMAQPVMAQPAGQ